ncbi:MAG: VOC family protein [Planctomycetes bacterium]|nr:VOC family protein [Planctomycetota bacterium]
MPALTQVRLLVDDFAGCHRFYRQVIGLMPRFGEVCGPYDEFETGSTQLALFQRRLMAAAIGSSEAPATTRDDRTVVVIGVDNVDAAHARLSAHGVSFVAPPTNRRDWRIRTAHLRDPDGNLVELWSALT